MRTTLFLLVVFAVMLALGHCTATSDRPNSLGVPEFTLNPYTYLLALPTDGQILDGKYTNIRFWPYGTPALFDQSVLFCGDVSESFNNKTGPLVVTYRAQASQMYKGIACHDLKSVFELKGDQ